MIRKIARMTGNPQYDYAKAYIVLAGDKIYGNSSVGDDVTVNALMELDDNFIRYARRHGNAEDWIQLLDLIRPRFAGFDDDYNELCNVNYGVKQAMRVCEITHEDQLDVGGIKGLKISQY